MPKFYWSNIAKKKLLIKRERKKRKKKRQNINVFLLLYIDKIHIFFVRVKVG